MPTLAKPKLALLASRIRFEEKAILRALDERGVAYDRLDERALSFILDSAEPARYAAIFNRSISHTRAVYAARVFEAHGVRVVNQSRVVEVCGDKLQTSLALIRAGLPVPRTVAALTPEAALEAIDQMGFPVVIKPMVGSWGRLLARVNDRDAAEAILEHRQVLGSPQHGVVYVQEHIDKGGCDIRTLVIGERVIAAMSRCSDHWITNTARGGEAHPCPITPELEELSLRSARAVGGGMLAIDLLRRTDGTLLVNEVNHMMEFHGISEVCDVDIAACMVDYVLHEAGA